MLYDTLVTPARPIVDYNTQFSGITEELLTAGPTKTIGQVQQDLVLLFRAMDPLPYLVGHSIENDMKALKLVYPRVIDTAFLYPHPRGAPYKRGLKFLMQVMNAFLSTSNGCFGGFVLVCLLL
jgi:RNA exonuclease 1